MNVDTSQLVESLSDEILEISRKIYGFAELGSEEFKSSSLLCESLESHGFRVERNYMGMKTAFRAEYGNGGPTIGLLAEYDALPNGHSCGHNLISAWAYGVSVALSKTIEKGRIVLFGTPSEEGLGEYAGSKVIMADRGAFGDVDFVLGMHPDEQWTSGTKALSDIIVKLTFHGKSAHAADSPQSGVNALDAAVSTYCAVNNLRSWAKNDKHVVIGMIFGESGRATNVVPDLAELEIDVRSTSGEFLAQLVDKIRNLAKGISEGYGAKLEFVETTPLYQDYLPNETIDGILSEELEKLSVRAKNMDKSPDIASGSTDEANVSKVVPTGHIDVKIGKAGTPGHSDEFREAANPDLARENLMISIKASVDAGLRILGSPSMIKAAKKELAGRKGKPND